MQHGHILPLSPAPCFDTVNWEYKGAEERVKNKLEIDNSDLTICHSGLRLSTERLVYITHKMAKAFGNCQSQSD